MKQLLAIALIAITCTACSDSMRQFQYSGECEPNMDTVHELYGDPAEIRPWDTEQFNSETWIYNDSDRMRMYTFRWGDRLGAICAATYGEVLDVDNAVIQ